MKEQYLVNPTKNYRRLSNGDVLSGEQVNYLLDLSNPVMQAVILFDIEETSEPVNVDKNWRRVKEVSEHGR